MSTHPDSCPCLLARAEKAEAARDKALADNASEAEEFNAGFDAYRAGTPESDEPAGGRHDVWRVGWAWAAHCDVDARQRLERAEARAAEWEALARHREQIVQELTAELDRIAPRCSLCQSRSNTSVGGRCVDCASTLPNDGPVQRVPLDRKPITLRDAFALGAEWAAMRYCSTGEPGFYAIVDAVALARLGDRKLAPADGSDPAVLPCGHPTSLLIKTIESGHQFCELCEMRSQRNDAEKMEAELQVELAALKEEKGLVGPYCCDECDGEHLAVQEVVLCLPCFEKLKPKSEALANLSAAIAQAITDCGLCGGDGKDGYDNGPCLACAGLRAALPDWKSRAAELRAKEANRDRFVAPALEELKRVERSVTEPVAPAPSAALSEEERRGLVGILQESWRKTDTWDELAGWLAARPPAPDPAALVERRTAEEIRKLLAGIYPKSELLPEEKNAWSWVKHALDVAIRERFAPSGRKGAGSRE